MQGLNMQRVLAVVGLAAAVGFVTYSAATLHETAQSVTNLAWQKPWAAFAAVVVVIYEALALVFAGLLWERRNRIAAIGVTALLIAATCFTFRLELYNQIQGSADTLAARLQTINQAKTDKEQLDALKQQQAGWTAQLQKPESLSQRERRELGEKLDRLNRNIEEIIKRQGDRTAIIEATPEAALAARLLGGDEAHWRDWMALMLIWFWPLARIVATPAAVAFWTIAFERTEGERIDAAFEVTKIARIKPAIQEVIKADPVPQLVEPEDIQEPSKPLDDIAPIGLEAPSVARGVASQDEGGLRSALTQEGDLDGTQEGRIQEPKKEAKRPSAKQIRSAAKADPGKVVLGPFGLASGNSRKAATSDLKTLVASFVASLEPGEYPVDALHKRIAPTAKRSGLNPAKRHVGEALRELEFEAKKRAGKIVYLITGTGGASEEARAG